MAQEGLKRKLAAIPSADRVGYRRLMGDDEAPIVRTITSYRKIISTLVKEYFISKTAFDHIESKLPYGYDFIGDQTVKNIAKPVGAYRVLMEPRVTVTGIFQTITEIALER